MLQWFDMDTITEFQRKVWSFYKEHRRDLVWRTDITPYNIFISEVMLQQTQVPRIVTKFPPFITRFPNFDSLATAPFKNVLSLWQGIGYNRRAKYLQHAAEIITNSYNGQLPDDPVLLEKLPGIGKATAASIVVYAYNKPVPFIETNVRRVFIHHFFKDKTTVHDKELKPFVEKTMDIENPREWYWALMDYGTWLAKTVPNPNRKSKHYVKQSSFTGSNRQLRGKILRQLLDKPYSVQSLVTYLNESQERVGSVMHQLQGEGFVKEEEGIYSIK